MSEHNHKPNFQLTVITLNQLRLIVKNMKPTTSCGTDSINMETLKTQMSAIEDALLNIVNTSITTNTFPTNLKTQKILPNLKPGKPDNIPLSYRPNNILESI